MRKRRSVWVVQHDESPDDTVLGVFETPDEADSFAEEVKHQFETGVFCTEFEIGFRFDRGSARYRR